MGIPLHYFLRDVKKPTNEYQKDGRGTLVHDAGSRLVARRIFPVVSDEWTSMVVASFRFPGSNHNRCFLRAGATTMRYVSVATSVDDALRVSVVCSTSVTERAAFAGDHLLRLRQSSIGRVVVRIAHRSRRARVPLDNRCMAGK